MPSFRYQAMDAGGQTVNGQLDAADQLDAIRQLKARQITPMVVEALAAPAEQRRRRTGRDDRVQLIRELATLLKAGVSLADAVTALQEAHQADNLGDALAIVSTKLRAGSGFEAALAASGLPVPDYLPHLVRAGEQTGRLGQALDSAASQMEYEERVRKDIISALVYPCILVGSGIVATMIIFLFVVPKFSGLLKSGKAKIPLLSEIVIKSGMFVQANALAFGIGAVALIGLVVWGLSDPLRRRRLMEKIAGLPLVGAWLVQSERGRFAATLATLLENRVALLSALELAADACRLSDFERRIRLVVRDLRAGKLLADAVAGQQLLPATGVNMIRVGERTGELPTMMRSLAAMEESSGRDRMKRFLALLEPVAILVIGVVIGTLMAAIMMAITSLNTTSI